MDALQVKVASLNILYKDFITNLEMGVFDETIYHIHREIMEKLIVGVVTSTSMLCMTKDADMTNNEKDKE